MGESLYKQLLEQQEQEIDTNDKYLFESILSSALVHYLLPKDGNNCNGNIEEEEEDMNNLLSYCDSGEYKTPILPDHDNLVPIQSTISSDNEEEDYIEESLPCHFHTRE